MTIILKNLSQKNSFETLYTLKYFTWGLGLVHDLSRNRTPPPHLIGYVYLGSSWSVSLSLTHSDLTFDHGDHSPFIVRVGKDAAIQFNSITRRIKLV